MKLRSLDKLGQLIRIQKIRSNMANWVGLRNFLNKYINWPSRHASPTPTHFFKKKILQACRAYKQTSAEKFWSEYLQPLTIVPNGTADSFFHTLLGNIFKFQKIWWNIVKARKPRSIDIILSSTIFYISSI